MFQPHSFLCYGVALVGRINKITGRFCKRALSKRQYSAKETYDLIDPTDRSHPIPRRTHESLSKYTSIYASASTCVHTHADVRMRPLYFPPAPLRILFSFYVHVRIYLYPNTRLYMHLSLPLYKRTLGNTLCSTLQQNTATHCNTLQHAVARCSTLQHTCIDVNEN